MDINITTYTEVLVNCIHSCKNYEQLKVCSNMIENFISIYNHKEVVDYKLFKNNLNVIETAYTNKQALLII